jgi:glycerol-3-phosphate dehydrogenase (NAD(P)+)
MDRVAILGAGSWGTALTTLLPGVAEVRLWAHPGDLARAIQSAGENRQYLPGIPIGANVRVTESLDDALSGAECVVFAVPSAAVEEVATAAAPRLASAHLWVNAGKGLDPTSGRRLSEVIAGAAASSGGLALDVARRRIAVLSGPNLAVEVARGIPTASVAASVDPQTAAACQSLWLGPTFRVYTSSDVVGVELAGAMKNVVAIGAGICEGLGYGDNSRAALMTRGLAEITRLGETLGARASTFLGLAGVGDLIATAGSRLSRNFRVGIGLGQGKPLERVLAEIGQVAEGVPTTKVICRIAAEQGVEMPICEALHGALFEGRSIPETIHALMARPPRREASG